MIYEMPAAMYRTLLYGTGEPGSTGYGSDTAIIAHLNGCCGLKVTSLRIRNDGTPMPQPAGQKASRHITALAVQALKRFKAA